MSKQLPFLGKQLVLELYECPLEIIDNQLIVEQALLATAAAIQATVVDIVFHKFSPQGVSGVVVIMESHIAIHTWPEHGYAAVDIFTCGDMDLAPGVEVIRTLLQAGRVEEQLILRGKGVHVSGN
jgi:S-adenosylmethionine decarboxylase proenzyme